MTRCMALLLAGALALVAVATAFPRAEAQTLPLPPLPELPAPPVDGSVLSDALGPLATDYCDTVATVYALAGPIASAQLPPELRALVDEVTPYLSVVTYACGLLVSPPTGVVCATDDQLAQQLGVLGLPLSAPTPVQVLHDTAAGIEHVFLRAGIDIGPDVSRQLALILGCGVAPEVEPPPAAAAPVPAVDEPPPPASAGAGFASPAVRPPAAVGAARPGTITVEPGVAASAGSVRYPVDGVAVALLVLPLVALVAAGAIGPRVRRGRRRARPEPIREVAP